jgi:hypothetical protein
MMPPDDQWQRQTEQNKTERGDAGQIRRRHQVPQHQSQRYGHGVSNQKAMDIKHLSVL